MLNADLTFVLLVSNHHITYVRWLADEKTSVDKYLDNRV